MQEHSTPRTTVRLKFQAQQTGPPVRLAEEVIPDLGIGEILGAAFETGMQFLQVHLGIERSVVSAKLLALGSDRRVIGISILES